MLLFKPNFLLADLREYRIPTHNSRILTAWDRAYKGISICNNILYQLENTEIEINSTALNEMKGQAILIRSLIYFNLVRAFGAIPYIDKKIAPLDAYEYLRVEPATIYENVIEDLNYAKTILPEKWTGNNIGRVTKFGASAILSKVHLTIGDKGSAKVELENIINSNLFSLDANQDGNSDINDLEFLFDADTKNCKSSVLEVQYMAGPNAINSGHQASYSPFYYSFSLPGDTRLDYRGNGHNSPSDDLIEEFENGDPRKDMFLRTGYIDQESGEFVYFPFTMKFYDLNWDNPGQNVEIIRYADILLMYSEVTDDPLYLNMVRARAGMSLYGTDDYPSDKYPTLALAIEHERRIELCHEFHRLFDLVRTNRALEKIPSLNTNKLLFPIPQYAIDVNNELTQNPGY
ncbi:RagB/SusD family nutrient uptake outer membrane protein [Mariniphaga sp.]|uniref:RagB/SusD family nutrient uptake outer membrane protein n=1 Tax=Mariniphaga sp. TaxID=1954475 RepID=UPI00356532EF